MRKSSRTLKYDLFTEFAKVHSFGQFCKGDRAGYEILGKGEVGVICSIYCQKVFKQNVTEQLYILLKGIQKEFRTSHLVGLIRGRLFLIRRHHRTTNRND